MRRTIRIDNPNYTPISVGWRLRMEPLLDRGLVAGRVEYTINSPEASGQLRRKISFDCAGASDRLVITGIGRATETMIEDGQNVQIKDQGIILREIPKEAMLFLMALRKKVEEAWERFTPVDVSKPVDMAGVARSTPDERRVRKRLTVEVVSFEALELEPCIDF